MEKDTLNDLFKTLEGQFDTEAPRRHHEKRFLEKLNQQDTAVVVSKQPNRFFNWKPILAVAASIVLCFSVFTVMQQEPEMMDLASISPELSETQSFFTATIEQELVALEAERSPETANMIDDAMKALNVLEKEYETLKLDLTESGHDKRVIYAMINNFQNRIDVLNSVLEHIEEVKNLKNNQNENTITI